MTVMGVAGSMLKASLDRARDFVGMASIDLGVVFS